MHSEETQDRWQKAHEISEALQEPEWAACIVKLDAIVLEQEKRLRGHALAATALMEKTNRLESQVSTYKACALEIAQELASAGSRDHKSKNEVILHAIARLMAFSTNYPDDVPF